MSFYFLGKGPFSKSLLLRALIVHSYFPELQIKGDSRCEDVLSMKKGLHHLQKKNSAEALEGGAVFRFLTLKASRLCGRFILKGSSQLFQRPLAELNTVLNQLSCETKWEKQCLILKSAGWSISGDALTVPGHCSSQFASAVFLNSWNLKRDLFVHIEGDRVSSAYLQMTLCLLRSLGMKILGKGSQYCVPAGQKINKTLYQTEPDMSCLFSLSALAGAGGEVMFMDWPETSLQPDYVFPSVLQEMGFQVIYKENTLKIVKKQALKPLRYNLRNSPDLFPVLSALCAIAEGPSRLYGAPHLAYKESHRIQQTARLLNLVGRKTKLLEDGLIIEGKPFSVKERDKKGLTFDSAGDHRMAMAGAVLKKIGWPLKILNPLVVNKSFSDFWKVVGLDP